MVCAAMSGVILWSEVSLLGQLLVNGLIKHAQPLRALLSRSQGDVYAGRVGGRTGGGGSGFTCASSARWPNMTDAGLATQLFVTRLLWYGPRSLNSVQSRAARSLRLLPLQFIVCVFCVEPAVCMTPLAVVAVPIGGGG